MDQEREVEGEENFDSQRTGGQERDESKDKGPQDNLTRQIISARPRKTTALSAVCRDWFLNPLKALMGSSRPSMEDPSKIDKGLFLGSHRAVTNKKHLLDLRISSILTVARGLPPEFPDTFKYTIVDIEDNGSEELAVHFERCFAAIDEGRAAGGIVVHCVAGISRSVSIVVAYLMFTKRIPFKKAMSLVKHARPIAHPNLGFVRQLHKFEDRLFLACKKPPKHINFV